ncbi:MAG: coenzyme F420-0:L-glutamate ligase [Promicromonosporaceae bacterium]|nr:coenzyme F420-0:L-glutamate ligase [Promicromonosporaceae bacterium]
MSREFACWALEGIPEVRPGDALAELVAATGVELQEGDILVVTSKIVSKAEGRIVAAADREAAITAETVRVVARRGSLRIVENRLGLIMAAAGVDASNTPAGTVLLLPKDPDASAARLRADLLARFGLNRLGVIISDTAGRPWRAGLVDIAIGAAGVAVCEDLRGQVDAHGRPLEVTVSAVADEIAAASELVRGKAAQLPVAVVRGLPHLVPAGWQPADGGARRLLRPRSEDLFWEASAEAYSRGYAAGRRLTAPRSLG